MSETPNVNARKLEFLDGLRGIAALYVMIGHARWLLWEGYSEGYLKHAQEYGLINKLQMYFFSLFKYGHEVVLFFFVLSGFVIHLKYALNKNKPQPDKFNFTDYLYRRVKRIYPPFLFALILTFLLDTAGRWLGFSIYSGSTPYTLINENVGGGQWDLKTLLGNIGFLYKEYAPVYGTNGPAWSLKYEWWFYMLYPLFLLAGTKKIMYPTLIMVLLFIGSFFPQLWPEKLLMDIFSMMLAWWLGVLLAETYAGRIKPGLKYLSFSTLILFIMPFWQPSNNALHNFCIAIFFFGLLSLLLYLPHQSKIIKAIQRFKLMGDFSYTLYIIHFPILVFLSGWCMQKGGNTLPRHFLFVWAGIIVSFVSAYAIHFFTEIPFIRKKHKQAIVPNIKVAGTETV